MRPPAFLSVVALVTALALGGCPWFAKVLPERAMSPGRAAYLEHCAFCHGMSGRGDGSAAEKIPVPPADFSSGHFKLRSTPSGEFPTDDDLLRTITRGIAGSGMPSFRGLPLETRKALVVEVKNLSRPRGGGKSYFEDRPPTRVIAVPERPAVNAKALAEGQKLYVDLGCPACHGEEGRGDGSSAGELKDYAKRPLRPTDFRLGVFMSGADPRELYLRIATGLNGTPMPEYGDDLITPAQRWEVVEYLLSLVGR